MDNYDQRCTVINDLPAINVINPEGNRSKETIRKKPPLPFSKINQSKNTSSIKVNNIKRENPIVENSFTLNQSLLVIKQIDCTYSNTNGLGSIQI